MESSVWVMIKIDSYPHSQNLWEDFISIPMQHFVWENTVRSVGTSYNSHYFISIVYFGCNVVAVPICYSLTFIETHFKTGFNFLEHFWCSLLMPSAFFIACTNTKAWNSNLWVDANSHCVIICKMWTELEREVKKNKNKTHAMTLKTDGAVIYL